MIKYFDILVLFTIVQTTQLCPKSCKCVPAKSEVICDGRRGQKYSIIPSLPANTTKLTFRHNPIHNLTRNTFINTKYIRLKVVKFQYCNVTSIEEIAFQDLLFLDTLELAGNTNLTPDVLSSSFRSVSKGTFRNLAISHMDWLTMPNDMFYGLRATNISKITLAFGHLQRFDSYLYKDLRSLKHLDLSWNGISKFSFNGAPNLVSLILAWNWMNFVPNFCNSTLNNSLKVLDLQYAKIQTLGKQFKCLDALEELNLSGLTLRLLYDNTFSLLPSLKSLRLLRLGSGLHTIRPNAFNSTSLLSLAFSTHDQFKFIKSKQFYPASVFANCKKLRYLDISYNRIQLAHNDLVAMFIHLKDLRILKMKTMQLEKVPVHFFGLFPTLKELYLDDNRISRWTKDLPFQNMTALKLLSMTHNRIAIINETSFSSMGLRGSLKALNLYGNPFSCTCEIMWFRNWMRSTNISLVNAENYKCALSNTLLINYNPTVDDCTTGNIVKTVVAVFVSIIVTVAVVALIVYVCRWRIRYQFYKLRGRYREYQMLPTEDNFVYDSYIIYADEDYEWIRKYLITKLESEQGFRLCIRDRDFQLGKIFSDELYANIEASRTIIVVMSNNFGRDQWCQFQLAIAQDKNVESSSLRLIPILLHEIEFRFVNETVYHFITRISYLSWNVDSTAQEMFWEQLLAFCRQR